MALDPYLDAHAEGRFGQDFLDDVQPCARQRRSQRKVLEKEFYSVDPSEPEPAVPLQVGFSSDSWHAFHRTVRML